MKFGVVVFPGSNCDDDMVHLIGKVLHKPVQKLWHKESDLNGLNPKSDCIIIPGGFSYGDYLRSGAIARFSPIMDAVIQFANEGGLVFGICNGFQVLCEAHLLPGALLRNDGQLFISKNVHLKTNTANSPVTRLIEENAVLEMPVAHADGRYYCDDETLAALRENDQILFTYCDKRGHVNAETNINGSVDNIAGICNEGRNVIGMMPHPERASEMLTGNDDGIQLFQSLIREGVYRGGDLRRLSVTVH